MSQTLKCEIRSRDVSQALNCEIRFRDVLRALKKVATLVTTVALAVSAAPAQAPDGAAIYAATCLACHQKSGLGLTPQFPPLVGSEWVTGNEERLILIILHGIVGEIEVEGETFNGAMPTWGPMFKDSELAAVATYVRQSWGNKAAPVTPATVTRVRLKHTSRTTPWTPAELQKALAKPPG